MAAVNMKSLSEVMADAINEAQSEAILKTVKMAVGIISQEEKRILASQYKSPESALQEDVNVRIRSCAALVSGLIPLIEQLTPERVMGEK